MPDQKAISEAELVDLCLRGDECAWSELVSRYQGLIYSVPRRMGLSPDDSADVFQRVCILLYQRLGAIRDPERLGGWLLTTASREAVRVGRRARRDVSLDGDDLEGSHRQRDIRDLTPLADDVCAELERAQLLRSALADLSARCRTILAEFLREDATDSYRDIARRLGIPIGSIGPTRARCLAQLRELLRVHGIDS
jgi:RNA polymerase sigma factor (sigma-70 family)